MIIPAALLDGLERAVAAAQMEDKRGTTWEARFDKVKSDAPAVEARRGRA